MRLNGGSSVLTGLGVCILLLTSCGSASKTNTVVRDVDAIQVMTPEEVTAMRSTLVPANENSSTGDSVAPGDAPTDQDTGDTRPLNKDNRIKNLFIL